MSARTRIPPLHVLSWVLLIVILTACSRAVGGPRAFEETAPKARATFEETLDRFGLEGARVTADTTLCQPTTNIALDGTLRTSTEPGQGLAIFNGIREYWLSLPGAREIARREPGDGPEVYDTRVAVDGGRSSRGGYDLFASFVPQFDALSVEVSTGCYRP